VIEGHNVGGILISANLTRRSEVLKTNPKQHMILQTLSTDRLKMLAIIKNAGCSVCAGTCEHRKPGELHCSHIGRKLKISSSGVKMRLREMVQIGLLKRERVERGDGKIMAEYTVTEKGVALIDEIG
jgi:DNA-binding MarR family transcriptional regulator